MEDNKNKQSEAVAKKVLGVRDFPFYDRNPFIDDLVVRTSKRTTMISKRKMICNELETDEEHVLFMGIKQELDSEAFVKLYKSSIKSFFELSNTAIKVFGYFMDSLRISNDKVLFNIKECLTYTGYKNKKSIFQGVAELLSKDFIARTSEHNLYYINLNVFFNGSRMVLIKEYVERKGTYTKESEKIKGGSKIRLVRS